ncbi:4071_t:CDS:2 [Ambispora gerdemannii]|uniref:4071_t:CDS:1 n=1 Tax=Ambispora gerdemannii TaxID=144530 RepID=A0A9N9F7D6_9GLOM|nr:4071_t:CDS:2 [Ambispora gerdemannii]
MIHKTVTVAERQNFPTILPTVFPIIIGIKSRLCKHTPLIPFRQIIILREGEVEPMKELIQFNNFKKELDGEYSLLSKYTPFLRSSKPPSENPPDIPLEIFPNMQF